MDGKRHHLISADGTAIGLLTAGTGPDLLLVHGGMGCIASWAPLWDRLARRCRVTAMDRRGRGSSGDTQPYDYTREFADVAAVAASLAGGDGSGSGHRDGSDGRVDVFGHSIGATFALGAAASGAPIRRLALYEPPGSPAAPTPWRERVIALIAAGKPGPAMISFLTEVVGLSDTQISELRNAPRDYDVLPIVAATMPREARALAEIDLAALAAGVRIPVLLLLGSASPAWARDLTGSLAATLPQSTLVPLPGCGHEGIDAAPDLVDRALAGFFAG
ncbi:MAG: alpha/beta hydrolase [Streptosporangiaceae bacterium]